MMPSFAQNLEKTLHSALAHASERSHEYATLEHLLLALIDDSDAALDEARTDAVKIARRRATLYAGAAGLKVVRILSISENGGYYGPPQVAFFKMQRADSAAAAPPVAAGELQMTANVTVLFELAP